MDKLEQFVKSVLNSRGINEQDKQELEIELKDHLNSLKLDYINNGYDEEKAIDLSIKEFGNPNTLGNDLKKYLVTKNKGSILTKSSKINGILLMCIIYFLITLFYAVVVNETLTGLYYLVATFATILGIYIYVNVKLYDKEAKIRYLSFFVIIFWVLERIIVLFVQNFSIYLRGGNFRIIPTLNLTYIVCYVFFSIVAVILIKSQKNNVFDKIKNPYNSKAKMIIIFTITVCLNVLYYLFPNRCYPLFVLVEKVVGKPINEVDRNMLYLVIDGEYFVPNLGLMIFLGLICMLLYKILKKGLRSLI